jgi:Zn-dependent protease
MNLDFGPILQIVSVWLLPLIFAITLHEAAHGWMANRLGDDTALRLGRVSFNPARHIDPFGTLILPGLLLLANAPVLFGYAKPVPVAFHRLNNPRRDMVWVAIAGPGINIALALASAFALAAVGAGIPDTWLELNLKNMVLINVVLAVFNMIPLPPLDGGRVAVGLLPRRLAIPLARLEPYGLLILIGLLFLGPFVAAQLGYSFYPLALVIWPAVSAIVSLIAGLAGLHPAVFFF